MCRCSIFKYGNRSLFLSGSKAVYGGRVPSFEEKDAGSGKMCSTILGLMKIDWRPKDSLDMLFCLLKRWKKGEKIDVSQYLNRRAVRLPCPQDLQMVNCSKKFQIDRRSEESEIKHKSQHQRHWNSSHHAMGSPSSLLRTKKVVKQFAFSWVKDTLCLHCTRLKMSLFFLYMDW